MFAGWITIFHDFPTVFYVLSDGFHPQSWIPKEQPMPVFCGPEDPGTTYKVSGEQEQTVDFGTIWSPKSMEFMGNRILGHEKWTIDGKKKWNHVPT